MSNNEIELQLLEVIRLLKSSDQTGWDVFVNNIPNILAAIFVILTVFYNCYVLKKTIKHTSTIESNKVSIELKKEWLANMVDALCAYHSIGCNLELYLLKFPKIDVYADEFLELNSCWAQASIRLKVLLDDGNKVHKEFKNEMARVEGEMVTLLDARRKGDPPSKLLDFQSAVTDKITLVVQEANAELVNYVNEMG